MNTLPSEWVVAIGGAAVAAYVVWRMSMHDRHTTTPVASSNKALRTVDMTTGIASKRGQPPFLYTDPSQLGDYRPATVDDIQDPGRHWH